MKSRDRTSLCVCMNHKLERKIKTAHNMEELEITVLTEKEKRSQVKPSYV